MYATSHWLSSGARGRTRTDCLQGGNLALYLVSYTCLEWVAGIEPAASTVAWSRSSHLSYTHLEPEAGISPTRKPQGG